MKAIRLHHRGGPDQLVLDDAPTPTPRAAEVRLRVRAAALTPGELTWDETYRHRDGTPRLPTIPGHDVAGVVDALGPGVSDLAIGDAVYGLVDFPLDGGAAEFVVMPAADLAPAAHPRRHPRRRRAPLRPHRLAGPVRPRSPRRRPAQS